MTDREEEKKGGYGGWESVCWGPRFFPPRWPTGTDIACLPKLLVVRLSGTAPNSWPTAAAALGGRLLVRTIRFVGTVWGTVCYLSSHYAAVATRRS